MYEYEVRSVRSRIHTRIHPVFDSTLVGFRRMLSCPLTLLTPCKAALYKWTLSVGTDYSSLLAGYDAGIGMRGPVGNDHD